MTEYAIIPATHAHWPAIEEIYREGIRTKLATFQTEAEMPDAEQWFAGKLPGLIFVAERKGEVVGWVALSAVSKRRVYAGVAEISVYIRSTARRRGIGAALMQHIVSTSEAAGIWTLQAGIFPENQASIRLHESVGFRVVGVREKLGKLDGVWRDVLLMERRSRLIY